MAPPGIAEGAGKGLSVGGQTPDRVAEGLPCGSCLMDIGGRFRIGELFP